MDSLEPGFSDLSRPMLLATWRHRTIAQPHNPAKLSILIAWPSKPNEAVLGLDDTDKSKAEIFIEYVVALAREKTVQVRRGTSAIELHLVLSSTTFTTCSSHHT
jgi:hypothetical protein